MTETPQDTDIRQLDEHTVARIAAGEVVERPASAVKELVENSVDAGADSVDVTVEEGGTELIRVADDGRGMNETDVRAAVREHTTSKIEGLEDLESGVTTLGFRGEALHTIGSVSRLTIRSRPQDGAEAGGAGTELVYEGGEVTSVEPTGCPAGTIVEVEDLFYNTPARRKFLKTTATEFAHVNRIVTRYALANPDVAVSLTHDGREVFATTGQGDLQAAVLAVYGRDVASAMIPVDADGDELPPGPLESVTGLVSHPETNRSSREYLSTYVNDRAVTADPIREGIMGAYGTQLGGDRYPFVVLFLEAPGETVDVNVHPRKREVRFDDDDSVRRQVDAAVEAALLEHGLLRSRAPRGRSAPGEARVDPGDRGSNPTANADVASFDAEADEGTTGRENPSADDETGANDGSTAADPPNERSASPPESSVRDGPAESVESAAPTAMTDDEPTAATNSTADSADGGPSAPADPSSDVSGTVDSSRSSVTNEAGGASGADGTGGANEAGRDELGEHGTAAGSDSRNSRDAPTAADTADTTGAANTSADPDRKFDAATEQRTLSGETATGDETTFDSLPALRVLGQLHDTYLVCETDDGLVLIDQHAADERVNYERLQRAFDDDPTAQALAEPVELELTAAEAEAFEHYRDALSRLGFYADRIDDRTIAVTTVPAVLEETLEPERLRDVLVSFVEGDREAGAETVDALADEFLGDLACYPSITGNTSLTEGSVVDLLEALDDCENPYACPHGRPVVVRFDERELEDRFERDYPGHQ
ncbi:DNA mismatch repair endonuclease MutL [Natronolimnohabitans innermongolicus]|uniref:DNA mismatch repair protein MutL n=1 Tax=Natronolimnohabitans innermongolicus JCM 12255 TaxID=1227499 RepID=L9WUV6_9EURY|nr:DNA mismatch repair endonuclease MutL [Natronolimnohabitans innermongolicus]ELY52971.1 DNA mismatch repair protein MutL [Natronolimnohabitans innermongolicus JCM 12255]